MPSIKNLEMAAAVSNHPHVAVKSAFFGLSTKAEYKPTHSAIRAIQQDYSADNGDLLRSLITSRSDQLAAFVSKHPHIDHVGMGPVRLEACLSDDNQFAALQLFSYSDFEYRPVTEARFFEGADAEIINTLLK